MTTRNTTKPVPDASVEARRERVKRLYADALDRGKHDVAAGIEAAVKVYDPGLKLTGALKAGTKAGAKPTPKKVKTGKKPEPTADMSDAEYQRWLDGLGLPESEKPRPKRSALDLSMPETDLSDEEVLAVYDDVISGEAGRRQAFQNVQEAQDRREAEMLEYCKATGNPLPQHMEHLRPQLRGYGY